MTIKVITPPTTEPVSLEEAKTHLRIDFTEDDAYISALISAARDYAEGFQHRALAEQTLELVQDSFCTPIRLSRPPLISVDSIKYRDVTGAEFTVDPSTYVADLDQELIVPAYSCAWPSVSLYPSGAVKVRYQAGYTPETIPQRTKQAILMLVAHWYENREAVVIGKTPTQLPFAVESLLWMDRAW